MSLTFIRRKNYGLSSGTDFSGQEEKNVPNGWISWNTDLIKPLLKKLLKKKLYDEKIISFNVADKLESSIRSIVKSECDAMKKVMSEPL